MRDKLKLIAAIDRLCKYPVPLTQKIRMISYDQDRLQKIFKIATAYEKTTGELLPNHGRATVKRSIAALHNKQSFNPINSKG